MLLKYILKNNINLKYMTLSIDINHFACENIYHFLIYSIYILDFIKNKNLDKEILIYYKPLNENNFVKEILNILFPEIEIISELKDKNLQNEIHISNFDLGEYKLQSEIYKSHHLYINHYYFLKYKLLPYIIDYKPTKKYSEYIFISRSDSKYRNIVNEDNLMIELEKYGFQKIVMTGLPLLEQMNIFYNSKIIIAAHGASLTNIIFCKENTKIIEINNKRTNHCPHFSHISNVLNLNFIKFTKTIDIHNHDEMANNILINNINDIIEIL
jgi:capsular polysaccharide biosynthesis protein